jgi:lysophosphatidic acid phosphatase type 6
MATQPAPSHTTVPAESELTLRHVLFFHRHGDRAPILTEVGSRWKMTPDEKAFWATKVATPAQLAALNRVGVVVGDDPAMPPHGVPRHRSIAPLAQLTSIGVDHMTTKGRALRTTYEAFITEHGLDKNPHEGVFVLSSNVDRTIQSVQCLLKGMFHPEMTDEPPSSDETGPVFHVRTQAINHLAPTHPIEIFNEIEAIVHHAVEQRDPAERAKMEALGHQLREIVGVPAEQNVPWTAIRDGLTCRKAHGMAFPEGITDDMYEVMCEYDSWLWHQLFGQYDFCFNAYEQGVRQVYEQLTSITKREPVEKPKISFFSAHDNSIVALISALQLQVERVHPGYGTIVTFEVYEAEASGQFYIKTLFEGTPTVFAGHEHSALCPFGHFEKLAMQFLNGPVKN